LKSHKTRGNQKPQDIVKPTVPRPFSLATERRATIVTRPTFEEDNKAANERKYVSKKNVMSSNMLKQSQVYADFEFASSFIV
jgi:hypothetical protein